MVDTEDEQLEVDAGFSSEHSQFGLHCIIDIATNNSLDKLIVVTGHVLRFIYNVKHFSSRMLGLSSPQELTKAKLAWIGDCQRQSYAKELSILHQSQVIIYLWSISCACS